MTPARTARHRARRWLDELRRDVERWRIALQTQAQAADIIDGILS